MPAVTALLVNGAEQGRGERRIDEKAEVGLNAGANGVGAQQVVAKRIEHGARSHAVADDEQRTAAVGPGSSPCASQPLGETSEQPAKHTITGAQMIGRDQSVPERRHAVRELTGIQSTRPTDVDAHHVPRRALTERRRLPLHLLDRGEHIRQAAHVGVTGSRRVVPAVYKDHHHRARFGHSAVDGCEHAIELGGPKRLSRVVRLDEEEGSARGVALGCGKVDAAGRTRRCEWNASDLLAVDTNRSGLVIEVPAEPRASEARLPLAGGLEEGRRSPRRPGPKE